jgi:DNA polymerase-3 subunit delta'
MSALEYGWQHDAWQLARAAIARGAHALLIAGARGVGKRAFALKLAASVLCERRTEGGLPCDACESCRWFLASTHPDFLLVEPIKDEQETEAAPSAAAASAREHPISVDQVRRLGESLALSSHRDAGKVVIIHPAELMNLAAANALLKNLEEPPSRTLFLLVAHRPALLPHTVRSRCQVVPIKVTDRCAAERWLSAQGVEDTALHLALCGGAPLEAQEAANDAVQAGRADFLRSLCDPKSDPVALAERFRDLPPAAILAWLQKWTYDLLQARLAGRVRYHLDLIELARERAGEIDPRAVSRLHRRLLAQQRHIRHPLNPRLLTEQLLIDCCELFAGAKDGTA